VTSAPADRNLSTSAGSASMPGSGAKTPQPLDAFDGGGLPGAVGADQPHDFSGRDVEVQTVHYHSVPVRLA